MVRETRDEAGEAAPQPGRRSWIVWIVACAICLGGGYVLGERSVPYQGDESAIRAGSSELSRVDSNRGLIDVLSDPDESKRAEWLARELLRMGPEALPEIVLASRAINLSLGAVEYVLLARAYSQHDPESAYRWALKDVPGYYRDGALIAALYGWARQAPLATAEEVGAMPPSEVRNLSLPPLAGLLDQFAELHEWRRSRSAGRTSRASALSRSPDQA